MPENEEDKKNRPILTGSLNPSMNNNTDVGTVSLWVVDSDNENAPMYSGTLRIKFPVLGETLDFQISLWNNSQDENEGD